eukprot:PITA_24256
MASSVGSNTLYIDYGVSFHMIGNKEHFSELEEDMQVHIELGDNGKPKEEPCFNGNTRGQVGTLSFERDSRSSLHLKDVLYVPSLKKNLVSMATLEDKGYDVIFSRAKAYLNYLASRSMKQICVRMKNLYRLQVETCIALSSKPVGGQRRDVGELWHMHMGHLHHGALKILQQIATGLP